MKSLKKRFKKRMAKRERNIDKEILSRAAFLQEYENLYGNVWLERVNHTFSLKTFRLRMKKIIKLKVFL